MSFKCSFQSPFKNPDHDEIGQMLNKSVQKTWSPKHYKVRKIQYQFSKKDSIFDHRDMIFHSSQKD